MQEVKEMLITMHIASVSNLFFI